MIDQLLKAFRRAFGSDPDIVVRAPGRVNLIGEHTDYNEGWVLPMAIDRAVYIAASHRSSQLASIVSLDFDQTATFRITQVRPGSADGWIAYPTSREPNPNPEPVSPGWAAYPAGVAWALRESGCAPIGIDAAFTSSVPIGAGLSSSAAVEVAFATAWQYLSAFELDPVDLARACQRAENDYVGVKCGIMDQMISAMGRAGHALLIDCRDLSTRHIPLPNGVAVIVCDTRVARSLESSAYNQRREECSEAVHILRRRDPAIRALRDVTPAILARYEDELPPVVRRRARHIVSENMRVLDSAQALQRGELGAVGRAMVASHISLRDDFEVSCRELNVLVEAALPVEGVIGARMTGAGFGGCTVSLVRLDAVERFLNEAPTAYRRSTGIEPSVYVCPSAEGASLIAGQRLG